MTRFYISQEKLDEWLASEKCDFNGDSVTVFESNQQFMVVPAVCFSGVSGDDVDKSNLIGTVRTERDLADMGAEHYLTSVIYDDMAYEVEQGFLGELKRQ